jgi:glycosyltransferase involved in cell wall biosynthesis
MNELKASIIIPVYQAEEYIRQCLDSIISQSFRDFEVIIIDDGSTDKSGRICDDYANRDSRIHVFHQHNQGVTAARKAGLAHAEGKYIFWVDADDYVESSWLEKAFARLNMDCSNIVLWNSDTFVGSNGKIVKQSEWKSQPLEDWKRNSAIGKYSVLWAFCASRKLWSMIQFPENITHAGEDGYLSLNLFLIAEGISVIPEVLYHHRADSANSISHHKTAIYYYDNYQLWDYRSKVCQTRYPELVDFCMQRALSAAVKAYCFDLYSECLKNNEKIQIENSLQNMAKQPITGRFKEKILSWAIREKYYNLCRLYIRHKIDE